MNNRFFWLAPIAVVSSTLACFGTQYLTIEQAQKSCFPHATKFVAFTIDPKSDAHVRDTDQQIWRAYSNSTFIGWFIVDNVIGKHDFITWALALNADGSVKQIEIMDYRETYGSEIRDAKWRSQFVGKKYGSPLQVDHDIKNISGATLSSRHITDGVNQLLLFYETTLKKS